MGTFVRMIVQREENKGVELTGGGGTVETLGNAEAEGGGEPSLLLIEGLEGISLRKERDRDVQHVERACAQKRSVRSCNPLCLLVSSGRKRDDPHHALLDIFAKESMDFHRISGPQFLSEKPQSDGVEDFDFRHVGKEQRQDRAPHLGRGRGRIHVENVEGEQEAGVDTGGQKRSSRSRAMLSAPETFMRFLPEVFFRRARKSGRGTRAAGSGGRRRAMRRLRFVMWISSPSRGGSSTAGKR